jgi:hypothetical protein
VLVRLNQLLQRAEEFLTFARACVRARGNWRKSSVFRDSELAARVLLAPENAIFDAI